MTASLQLGRILHTLRECTRPIGARLEATIWTEKEQYPLS